jgi:DNA repair protein RadC
MSEENKRLTIKELAEEDRPREKLIQRGASELSESELLAILIGSGIRGQSALDVARSLLERYQHKLTLLSRASVKEISSIKGLGPARAINIVAALELGKRRLSADALERPAIKSSSDAYDLIRGYIEDLDHEEFWLIMLNTSGKVIGMPQCVNAGGMKSVLIDVKIIMRKVLESAATAIIVAHNHPSGEVKPSLQDNQITKVIADAAKIFDIRLQDHIIVGDAKYYSYCDEGNL